MSEPDSLVEIAPAKVNLTLRVLGRRSDGYHEIESLVVFAEIGDTLSLVPGDALSLTVRGPYAALAGEGADNLVLRTARTLALLIPRLSVGAFDLDKTLPVAAGIGGGSADAAAALRLLARANDLPLDDERIVEAARSAGADVTVCLDPQPRLMRGIGQILTDPLPLPRLPAVLVNPGVPLATKSVFAGWSPAIAPPDPNDVASYARLTGREEFLQFLLRQSNDLEFSAIALAPAVAEVLHALRALPGRRVVRMSGSGATCFALFDSAAKAIEAGNIIRSQHPQWWVRASALGAGPTTAESSEQTAETA